MFSARSSIMPALGSSCSREHSLAASTEDICAALGLPDIVVPRLLNSPLPLQCLAAEALPDEMKREIRLITEEYASPQQEQSNETNEPILQYEPTCVLELTACINECMDLVRSDTDTQKIVVPKKLFLNGSGMRLVGGVQCQHTGAIHARILASNDFHEDGLHLKDGMCVLSWDECSLEGSTFEEVRRLVKSTTSSHVKLTVRDCRIPVWHSPSSLTHLSAETSKHVSGSQDMLSITKKRSKQITASERAHKTRSIMEDGQQGKHKKKVSTVSLPSSSTVVHEVFNTQHLNGMVELSLRYHTARGLLHVTLHKVKGRSGTPTVGGDTQSGAFLNTYIFPDIRSQGVKYARPIQSTTSTEEILERSAEYSLSEEEVQRTSLRVIVWESKKKTFKGEVFLSIGNTDVVNLHGVPQWYTICEPDPNLPTLLPPFIEQKQGMDTLLNKVKSSTQNLYLFTLRRTKKAGFGTSKVSTTMDLPSVGTPKETPCLSDLPKLLETLKDPKPKEAIASLSPAQKTNVYDLLACIEELVDKDSQHNKNNGSLKEDSCHNNSIASREASPCSEDNTEKIDTMSLLSTLGVLGRPEVHIASDGVGQADATFRNRVDRLSTVLEQIRDEQNTPKGEKICKVLYSLGEIVNDSGGVCSSEQDVYQRGAQGHTSQQLTMLSFLANLDQSSSRDQIEPTVSSTTLGSTSSMLPGEDVTSLPVWLQSLAEKDTQSSSSELPVAGYNSASWANGPRHIIARPCLKRYSFMDRLEQMNIELPVVPKTQQNVLSSSWESPLYDRLLPKNENRQRQSLPPLSLASSSPVHKLMTQSIIYRKNISKSLNNVHGDEPDGAVGICRDGSDTDSNPSISGRHTSFCDDASTTDPDEAGESSLDFIGRRRVLTGSLVPISHSLPQPVSVTVHRPVRTTSSLGSESLPRWKSADSLYRRPELNKARQKPRFKFTWGKNSSSVIGKMQAFEKGKEVGKMEVQLSAKHLSGQITIKMLDIEFQSDALMNTNYEVKASLYNKFTDRCEGSQDAAMSLKKCGRHETKLMPKTLHFSMQSLAYSLQIIILPTGKGFGRKRRSYHIWSDLSDVLEQKNNVCVWMKICKAPS